MRQQRSEKKFLLTGLRGVGKTVLLNEMERLAEAGYRTILIEAHEDKTLGALLVPPISVASSSISTGWLEQETRPAAVLPFLKVLSAQ